MHTNGFFFNYSSLNLHFQKKNICKNFGKKDKFKKFNLKQKIYINLVLKGEPKYGLEFS